MEIGLTRTPIFAPLPTSIMKPCSFCSSWNLLMLEAAFFIIVRSSGSMDLMASSISCSDTLSWSEVSLTPSNFSVYLRSAASPFSLMSSITFWTVSMTGFKSILPLTPRLSTVALRFSFVPSTNLQRMIIPLYFYSSSANASLSLAIIGLISSSFIFIETRLTTSLAEMSATVSRTSSPFS